MRPWDDTVQEMVAFATERLAKVGIEVGSVIACGVQGCVCEAGKKGVVVKLTFDARDANIAAWAMRHPTPVLPKVFEVYESTYLEGPVPQADGTLYAVLREDIPDLPRNGFDIEAAEDMADAVGEIMLHNYMAIIKSPGVVEGMLKSKQRVRDVAVREPKLKKSVREMLHLAELAGYDHIIIEDLHSANLGWRKGYLVLRDIGMNTYSKSEQKKFAEHRGR